MFHDPHCHDMLMAALALARTGLLVFPCVYCQKEPATKHGFYDATTNPATIKRWFGGNFRRNLAVRTGLPSGAWVLDIDDPDALTALQERHGPLPITRRSQSGRGSHLWFKTTAIPVPSSACVANGLVAEDGMRAVLATVRSGARAGVQHPRNRAGRA